MANWYYYDSNGQKQGPITGGQLKGLAKAGRITPETIVETEEGKKAPARKVQGLTFAATVPPEPKLSAEQNPFTATAPTENQVVPQSVAVPLVEGTGQSSWKITVIGIAAVLLVGGVGAAMILISSSKRSVNDAIKPLPIEPNLAVAVEKIENNEVDVEHDGDIEVENDNLFSREIIAKQVDVLIDAWNSRPLPSGWELQLSPSEKQAVVDYLILLQNKRNERHDQSELDRILSQLTPKERVITSQRIDVYVVNRGHIRAVLEKTRDAQERYARQQESHIRRINMGFNDGEDFHSTILAMTRGETGQKYRQQYENKLRTYDLRYGTNMGTVWVAGLPGARLEYYLELYEKIVKPPYEQELARLKALYKLLEGMLPESNRRSGNAHNAEEQDRLNIIQRQQDRIRLETEAKTLF